MSATSSAPAGMGRQTSLRAQFIYEWPVRLWHWLTVISIIVLSVTGFYIGRPFVPAMQGEAVDTFFMGWMRFAHFASGYIMAVLFAGRIYWAFVGNKYAKELVMPPLFSAEVWKDVWLRVRYYLFLVRDVPSHPGPNGLEVVSMFFFFTLPAIFLILTGFALYAEGAGQASWSAAAFGWVRYLFGDSQALHTYHRLAMWVLIVFVIIHVYLVIRQDVMSKQSYISTMISGYRMFRD
jgi:Ni/Fe-hydrogenase 1 B-type cytochrome subunit